MPAAEYFLVAGGRRRKAGRPPRAEVARTKSLKVRMTEHEHVDLKSVARENRLNMADIIRDAVNEFVADYRERKVFRGR